MDEHEKQVAKMIDFLVCENETNLEVIQSVVGYANIETTMNVYTDVTDAKKQEVMKDLAQKLNVF